MELRDYLAIIGRRWLALVVFLLIGTGGFAWYANSQPTTFHGLATLSLIKHAESGTTQYQFDNYYVYSTNDLIAKAAEGWLADPTAIASIYTKAAVTAPATSFENYPKYLKTKDLSGGSLEIDTQAASAKDAALLATTAQSFINNRLQSLMADGTLSQIAIVKGDVATEASKPSMILYTLIGLFTGAIIGLTWVFLAEYLSPSIRRK